MLAILIYRPSIWLAIWFGVLVAFRRVPWFANEIARMLSLDEQVGMTAWAGRVLLPAWDGARVMSNDEEDEPVRVDFRPSSDDIKTSSNEPVLPQQNQAEPDNSLVYEPPTALPSLHRMTRSEEIAMLAVQRNDDGTYRHSANDILKIMGGTAADVKGQIAAIRGSSKSPATPARVARPKSGWGGN